MLYDILNQDKITFSYIVKNYIYKRGNYNILIYDTLINNFDNLSEENKNYIIINYIVLWFMIYDLWFKKYFYLLLFQRSFITLTTFKLFIIILNIPC